MRWARIIKDMVLLSAIWIPSRSGEDGRTRARLIMPLGVLTITLRDNLADQVIVLASLRDPLALSFCSMHLLALQLLGTLFLFVDTKSNTPFFNRNSSRCCMTVHVTKKTRATHHFVCRKVRPTFEQLRNHTWRRSSWIP